MKRITFRQVVFTLGVFSALACFGGSGTQCNGDTPIATSPEISEFLPCKAAIGEDVVILGSHFFAEQGSGYVAINGVHCPVKSWTYTRIVATVPAGATSGQLTVTNSDRVGVPADETIEIGPRTPVAEIEPNDAIDGINATIAGRNQGATGSLSSAADRDHFTFDCIHRRNYRLKLTPRVVGTVYLNGDAVTLDANGEAVIDGRVYSSQDLLVGITGGTGAYAISIELASAP
jgi:hypothetical protein